MFTRGHRYWLGLSLAGFVALAGFAGWKARALFRSTAQFRAWPGDARVRYEPGAETLAAEVAKALPAAIRTVEQRQYQAFKDTPNVYVCASLASYAFQRKTGHSYGLDAHLF